jgi:hypothetical protein
MAVGDTSALVQANAAEPEFTVTATRSGPAAEQVLFDRALDE